MGSQKKTLGQLMLIGISGPSLKSEEKKFILENNIGGVTLFDRNIIEPKQVFELTKELHNLKKESGEGAPLFIGVDMEGGRVQRLKNGFTKWPSMAKVGKNADSTETFNLALRMGTEIRAAGFNLNYAPCVDVLSRPENKAIGDRSFGSDPELVGKLGSAALRGFLKAGIVPCIKHFPGHGNTLLDSHEALPIEDSTLENLEQRELIPFRRAVKARVDMVMTSHILFKNIDPDFPATLSTLFLKKILREELRFRGLIITDDLGMKALGHHFSADEIPLRALQAGVDLLLYCNEPNSPPRALEVLEEALANGKLSKTQIEAQRDKILKFKKEKISEPEFQSFEAAKVYFNCKEHEEVASKFS